MTLAEGIVQVAAASMRLAQSIGGVSRIEVLAPSRQVFFAFDDDERVVESIAALGMARRDVVSVCRNWTWIEGHVERAGILIRVTGPMRVIPAAAIVDASRVAEAVAAADEVAL